MGIFDTPEYKERWAMYDSALKAGIPIVSTETCAIICAMLLVWGNTAEFTHNHRLVCELQYAQKRFHIEGGEKPTDRNFLTAFNYYTDLRSISNERTECPTISTQCFKKDTAITSTEIKQLSRFRPA